jgi:hypothetical protein
MPRFRTLFRAANRLSMIRSVAARSEQLATNFLRSDKAQLVIGLNESEHRPMIERRFPELGDRITYWDVDDVELAPPSEALAMIDNLVEELILTLRQPCAVLRN